MSEEKNHVASGDDPNNPSGDTSSSSGTKDNQKKDAVAYESFQKALEEKKRAQEHSRSLEERLKVLEEEKLKAEGNKDKLLERYQKSAQDAEVKLKEKTKRYAENALKSQIALKAKELGCRDTDILYKAMDLEKLRVDLVDDDLNVDEKSLMNQLETLRKEKFYLFEDKAPRFRDGPPNSKVPVGVKKPLSEMTMQELREFTKANPHLE